MRPIRQRLRDIRQCTALAHASIAAHELRTPLTPLPTRTVLGVLTFVEVWIVSLRPRGQSSENDL